MGRCWSVDEGGLISLPPNLHGRRGWSTPGRPHAVLTTALPPFAHGTLRLSGTRAQSRDTAGQGQSRLCPQACCFSSWGPHTLGGTAPRLFLSPSCTSRSKPRPPFPALPPYASSAHKTSPKSPRRVRRKWAHAQGPPPPGPRTTSCHPLPTPEVGLASQKAPPRSELLSIALPSHRTRE